MDNCHEDSGDTLYKKFIEEFMYKSKRAYSDRTPPLFIPKLFWRLSDLNMWEPAHTFVSIIQDQSVGLSFARAFATAAIAPHE